MYFCFFISLFEYGLKGVDFEVFQDSNLKSKQRSRLSFSYDAKNKQ